MTRRISRDCSLSGCWLKQVQNNWTNIISIFVSFPYLRVITREMKLNNFIDASTHYSKHSSISPDNSGGLTRESCSIVSGNWQVDLPAWVHAAHNKWRRNLNDNAFCGPKATRAVGACLLQQDSYNQSKMYKVLTPRMPTCRNHIISLGWLYFSGNISSNSPNDLISSRCMT